MGTNDKPIIGIVSPCYNEEDVISSTIDQLTELIDRLIAENCISEKSFVAFVDDGSYDNTWRIIVEKSMTKSTVTGIKLTSNVGHQKALLAGLIHYNNKAEALISIDADLQDDITVIESMIVKFKAGAQTVYGVREERKTDSIFKRTTATLFYKLMLMMKINVIYNHADFRLCSKKVIQALMQYGETNLFLRGIIPTIAFKSEMVYYNRLNRLAGKSKYTLKKMLYLAWEGITSFSNYPLKLVTRLGFFIFFTCMLLSIYAFISMYRNVVVPGWLSTVLPMYFLGGIQLFCIGVLGEYIGKIYLEVKQRPRYTIEETI